MVYAGFTGWGMYLPERILSNADLQRMVDTSDEWIRTRTGIQERHIAGPRDSAATMGTAAALAALQRAHVKPDQVDLLIVATWTPDTPIPSTACHIKSALGALHAAPMDVQAACCGWVYGVVIATQFIRAGTAQTALVIGSDVVSRYVDYTNRNTCILFGDGAGAVVLQATAEPADVLACDLGGIDGTTDLIHVPGLPRAAQDPAPQYMYMAGQDLFRLAVRTMGDSSATVIAQAGLKIDEIDLMIPHQAYLRMIEAVAKRLDLPRERALVNIDRYGNTSAATIPIAICEAVAADRLHDGDDVLLTSFGTGLTWGSAIVKWRGQQ